MAENWGSIKGGLYGSGMHNYILNEIEYGERVAMCIEDKDASGWDAIDDLIYLKHMQEQEALRKFEELWRSDFACGSDIAFP